MFWGVYPDFCDAAGSLRFQFLNLAHPSKTWHARRIVSQILWVYAVYPSGEEPTESVWTGEEKPGR